jgi:antitoxin (DNA-binding transcriptional repressor) of toxin-antitoxin stability system
MNKPVGPLEPTAPLSIEEASARLPELVALATQGQSVRIQAANQSSVRLVADDSAPEDEKRRVAHARLVKWLETRPAVTIGPWTREELYERE